MRIKLDRTICDGFGTCADYAPDLFSLDDWGYASLVSDGTVSSEAEERARRALLGCPVHAIIELLESGKTMRPVKAAARH